MTASDRLRFEELYKSHHQMVRGLLFNMVDRNSLDDLVQETFLKIWKGLPRFAFQSTTKTWIYRITINTALDHLRKGSVSFEEWNENTSSAPEVHLSDTQQEIQKALQQLEESHRAVLVLFYFEELGIGQIASILEIPRGTVKSRLFNGRQQLRHLLDEKGELHEISQKRA